MSSSEKSKVSSKKRKQVFSSSSEDDDKASKKVEKKTKMGFEEKLQLRITDYLRKNTQKVKRISPFLALCFRTRET